MPESPPQRQISSLDWGRPRNCPLGSSPRRHWRRQWRILGCWSPWIRGGGWRLHCSSTFHTWWIGAFGTGHKNHSHTNYRPPRTQGSVGSCCSSPFSTSAFSLSASVLAGLALTSAHFPASLLFASLCVSYFWWTVSSGWPWTARSAARPSVHAVFWSQRGNCPMAGTSSLRRGLLLSGWSWWPS